MKTLLLLLSSIILLSTTHAVIIAKVYPANWVLKCIAWYIETWVYANDVAIAAWYATSPTFINNPSAIFLSGNNAGNVRAWSNSFGVNKCIFAIIN